MDNIQKIHFVGIKGVGMAPLAIMAKEAGVVVTGSDVAQAFITDAILLSNGIVPEIGFDPQRIDGAQLVITTGAHGGYDNPEVIKAREKGITVLTQGEAVGYFMQGKVFHKANISGISVTGCHGKTTTTALIATLLMQAGKDPSFIIGTGEIPSLGTPGHFGKGDYFIAEADEYATEPKYDKTPKFLWQHPRIGVITNIDFDHPDLYGSIEEVRGAYLKFIQQLENENSTLIAYGDDQNIKKILEKYNGKIHTFGFNSDNFYVLKNVTTTEKTVSFTLLWENNEESYILSLPGEHNVLNAAAAILVAKKVGLTHEEIQNGLHAFVGTKRRLEYLGNIPSGALMYDDYAHHPAEIQASLKALKERYPNKKIVAIFQPHTYSRTIKLFEQFVDSFTHADEVILTDIYASAREKVDTRVSSQQLSSAIKTRKEAVLWLGKLTDVVQYLQQKAYSDEYVIVSMGAGDIYTIFSSFIKK